MIPQQQAALAIAEAFRKSRCTWDGNYDEFKQMCDFFSKIFDDVHKFTDQDMFWSYISGDMDYRNHFSFRYPYNFRYTFFINSSHRHFHFSNFREQR